MLDFARARQWREGDNPAAWRGHLSELLPARRKIAPVEHHAALPWQGIGAFAADLRQVQGVAPRALEFLIATAARTGETLGARWKEIDQATATWTVPAQRMENRCEHRVPLSSIACMLLDKQEQLFGRGADDFVFPGRSSRRPLSNMALTMVLRRMKRADLTVHGFRSTFRDWASEATTYPNELAEAALAHGVGNKVEAAYRRGDLFARRRAMMTDWAAACAEKETRGETVVTLQRQAVR